MVDSNTDPPAVKDPGWFQRLVFKCTPKKWHGYLTPQVFVAWNLSSVATDAKWLLILFWKDALVWLKIFWVEAIKWYKVVKEAAIEFYQLVT